MFKAQLWACRGPLGAWSRSAGFDAPRCGTAVPPQGLGGERAADCSQSNSCRSRVAGSSLPPRSRGLQRRKLRPRGEGAVCDRACVQWVFGAVLSPVPVPLPPKPGPLPPSPVPCPLCLISRPPCLVPHRPCLFPIPPHLFPHVHHSIWGVGGEYMRHEAVPERDRMQGVCLSTPV